MLRCLSPIRAEAMTTPKEWSMIVAISAQELVNGCRKVLKKWLMVVVISTLSLYKDTMDL